MSETVTYVVGDVHGEANRLSRLHGLIFAYHQNTHPGLAIRIVHLGDYVDRGPDSAQVIDLLMALEAQPGICVISLAGNHEALLLAAVQSNSVSAYRTWLGNGGDQTLNSYRNRGLSSVPPAHVDWLSDRTRIHVDPTERRIFVHAGIDPNTYPAEDDSIYLWTRSDRFFHVENWHGTIVEGWTIIHGHTPTMDGYPEDECEDGIGRRINLDTGAVYGGRLTCAVLAPGREIKYIYS